MLGHAMLMAAGAGGGPLASVVFDSAAKVSGYSIRYGSPTITFDSTNIGMSIAFPDGFNFISYDAFGAFSRPVRFDAKVKFVSDSFGRKHMGFFCDSGSSGINAYRLATLDSAGGISKFVGTTETTQTVLESSSITLSVGQTYDLSAIFLSDGTIKYLINNVLITRVSNSDYASIRPGFFGYGAGILVKSLSVSAA